MSKAAVFTMKLEPDLRAAFMAAAEASHRPASQVVRELMREFVTHEQDRAAHSAFVDRKVAVARQSVAAGQRHDDESVAAEFAALRAGVADRT